MSACVLLGSIPARAVDDYTLSSESTTRMTDVPAGRLEPFQFNDSKVFPGTQRDGWIYVPAEDNASTPAALMVFQDGHAYVSTNGQMRAPIVFDNLIAKGDLPPAIGLFVNPGYSGENAPQADGWGNRSNRSVEDDSLTNAYARFLIEELIPFITNRYHLNLSGDPRGHAICGMSSGGICAFTAAWERPDYFGKVLSHIGSFTDLRGGHVYPALIRRAARKPIRVFLQEGANDLNNQHGHWPLANQEMTSSLGFMGYDYRFVLGDGAHNGKHGGTIFPDSLRWLWREESLAGIRQRQATGASDEQLKKLLADGSEWELVGEGYRFTDAACSDGEGNFHFSDLPRATVYRVAASGGEPEKWLENGPKISGLKLGPDGRLYAATQGEARDKRIVAIDRQTKAIETLATDVQPNDLVVSRAGWVYFTDTGAGAVVRLPISARGMSRLSPVAGGINKPNGITLSPDQRTLIVSEYGGTNAWTFQLGADGGVTGAERLMDLRKPAERPDSGGDGMTTDGEGRSWVTSHAGIQVFDPAGRLLGVLPAPQAKGIVSCAFAGPGHSHLYVCNADKVFRRKTLAVSAPM